MEYAKDIVLDLKNGQVDNSSKKELLKKKEKNGLLIRFFEKMTKHKVMTTVITTTVGFMILDILLISSFINVLTKI